MTTLNAIADRLADVRTIDHATAVDLILDQVVAHDMILGQITDPQDIPDDLAGDLINTADAAYGAAGALALGETAHPAPGVTIVPVQRT